MHTFFLFGIKEAPVDLVLSFSCYALIELLLYCINFKKIQKMLFMFNCHPLNPVLGPNNLITGNKTLWMLSMRNWSNTHKVGKFVRDFPEFTRQYNTYISIKLIPGITFNLVLQFNPSKYLLF